MLNNLSTIKLLIFPILRELHWAFRYCSMKSYHSQSSLLLLLIKLSMVIALPSIAIAEVVAIVRIKKP